MTRNADKPGSGTWRGLKRLTITLVCVALTTVGCAVEETGGETDDGVAFGRGVDGDDKVIRIGGLFDLSGPVASLGVPYEAAVNAAIDQINDSDRLGDWTIEYSVRDHAFNTSNSVAMYDDLKDDVLAIAPSFGTQPTAPLLARFEHDNMLAFVGGGASSTLSSHTIWGGSSYRSEAARAVEYALETKGDELRLGVIRANEDSGEDVIDGVEAAADALGVEVTLDVVLEPTADDFSAAISRLEDAGVTDVIIGTSVGLASGSVATAHARGYQPDWYGILPSFLELAWYGNLPAEAWGDSFHWVHGMPYWGEDRPGMSEFVEAYEASSAAEKFPGPQVWALVGYMQMQHLAGVLEAAIDAGDLTPEGVYEAAEKLSDFDADGLLLGPVDPIGTSGPAASRVRVLVPDVENQTWDVVSDAVEVDY